MENDILEALNDIGYEGPILEENMFEKALEGGPKSLEYTTLVEWLAKELKTLCQLDEHVNAITSPDDSSSFLLELSSFLKELGCAYICLTEGHLSERLNSRHSRSLLLDYLLTELEAARMIRVNKPVREKELQVKMAESSTALDLKSLLMALKFPKPPAQITAASLFSKVENKVKEAISSAPKELVGTPLFTGVLSSSQWETLAALQTEMLSEYRIRRQMLIKRLDVTAQSFLWSERVRKQVDEVTASYSPHRQAMLLEPSVTLSDVLAARNDLAIIEKTSSASVRRNTQSSVNKVMIGQVPDRGGRASEQQPPPPEMPSWEKNRVAGGDTRGRGGGGRGGGFHSGGGRGGDRGGGSRVQGNWNHGQDNRGGGYQGQGGANTDGGSRGNHQDGGGGNRGGGWGRGGRGGRGGNRGGYQQR